MRLIQLEEILQGVAEGQERKVPILRVPLVIDADKISRCIHPRGFSARVSPLVQSEIRMQEDDKIVSHLLTATVEEMGEFLKAVKMTRLDVPQTA